MSHILPTLSVTHADLMQRGTLAMPVKLQTTLSLPALVAIIVAHYANGGYVVDPESVRPMMHEEGYEDDRETVFDGMALTLDADVTISVKMKTSE